MYVCNVGIMFVCSSDQGRTVISTVKSFIKFINQIKSIHNALSFPHYDYGRLLYVRKPYLCVNFLD